MLYGCPEDRITDGKKRKCGDGVFVSVFVSLCLFCMSVTAVMFLFVAHHHASPRAFPNLLSSWKLPTSWMVRNTSRPPLTTPLAPP